MLAVCHGVPRLPLVNLERVNCGLCLRKDAWVRLEGVIVVVLRLLGRHGCLRSVFMLLLLMMLLRRYRDCASRKCAMHVVRGKGIMLRLLERIMLRLLERIVLRLLERIMVRLLMLLGAQTQITYWFAPLAWKTSCTCCHIFT